MTLSESFALLETLKQEFYRVYGVATGISRLAGALISHCAFLLADDRNEAIKKIVETNIQKEIETLKTFPDENLQ